VSHSLIFRKEGGAAEKRTLKKTPKLH